MAALDFKELKLDVEGSRLPHYDDKIDEAVEIVKQYELDRRKQVILTPSGHICYPLDIN